MKIDAIDVSTYPDDHERRIPGWGVSVSRRVWRRCVAVPNGCDGVSEEERVGDLLAALWTGVRRQVTENPEWCGGLPFTTEVHRADAAGGPPARGLWKYRPAVQLHALAAFDPVGRPYLLVLTPRELPAGICRLAGLLSGR